MATKDITAPTPSARHAAIPTGPDSEPLNFTANDGLYTIAPGATILNAMDQLDARLGQLTALVTMLTGEGLESFDTWNAGLRGSYLWNCAMLARECQVLKDVIYAGLH